MNTFKTFRKRLLAILLATTIFTCCSSPSIEEIPPNLPISQALNLVGRETVHHVAKESTLEVILIRDRHSTRPGFHRVRQQLRQVQRDNRLAVEYLLGKGFDLLFCEYPCGPLREDEKTQAQYRIIRSRMAHDYLLDEYAVFQPIRFQLSYGDRLEVWGAEDPELFKQDLRDFESFAKARSQRQRHDLSRRQKKAIETQFLAAVARLRQNIVARGEAAAKNVLTIMKKRGKRRAVLLVGGAHVPYAIAIFENAEVSYRVFESSRYAAEKDGGKAFADPEDEH